MGREIRQVPKGWQHPKDERGHYKPLYDQTYEEAAEEWTRRFLAWEHGEDPVRAKREAKRGSHYWFWEWEGAPPDDEFYRAAFSEPANCYQVYQTVSEGSPTSPVFETLDELEEWLISQGTSQEGARAFRKEGWCVSMILTRDQSILMNYEGLAYEQRMQKTLVEAEGGKCDTA